jgi:hypothetical protein
MNGDIIGSSRVLVIDDDPASIELVAAPRRKAPRPRSSPLIAASHRHD